MKRFIAIVALQSGKYDKYVYTPNNAPKSFEFPETRVPLIPMMNASVEPGETVEVILVAAKNKENKEIVDTANNISAFERNLQWTKEEIEFWANERNVTVLGLDNPIIKEEPSTMKELLILFEDLIHRVEANYDREDVFFEDITFGMKPMTLVLLYVMRYIRAIKKNVIEYITYGQVYWKEGRAELHELSPLFYMDSLISRVGEMDVKDPVGIISWSLKNAIEEE